MNNLLLTACIKYNIIKIKDILWTEFNIVNLREIKVIIRIKVIKNRNKKTLIIN